MIFSSSDIRDIIGGDPIFRSIVTIKIVDNKPPIEAGAGVFVYIKRYPIITEFEATWSIWIVDFDNEPIDVLIRQLRTLLPQFTILEEGAIVKASTTELLSDKTEKEPVDVKPENVVDPYEARFQDLAQSIEDRMLLVGPGRAGRDGKDGKNGIPGRDGKDGRDLIATEAELNDLKDVFVPNPTRGQFLMFDGTGWIAGFAPQVFRSGGSSTTSTGGNGSSMPEPPSDGRYYTRRVIGGTGQWVDLLTAMNSVLDGGDFDGLIIVAKPLNATIAGSSASITIS